MAEKQRRTRSAMGLEDGAGRQRWARVEAERDHAWLGWIGRFRFVTAELLALRFGVHERNARRRVVRLADAGLVSVHRAGPGQAAVIVLTPRGAQHVDLPPRQRAPRPELHREHELAVVEFVCQLELGGGPAVEVLTERDCRRRQSEGSGRCSVAVQDDRGRSTDRWPDVIVHAPAGRIAVEIEFAPKHGPRLERIVRGYLVSDLVEVRFVVASPRLAQRLTTIAAAQRAMLLAGAPDRLTRVVVDAWSGANEVDRVAIRSVAA